MLAQFLISMAALPHAFSTTFTWTGNGHDNRWITSQNWNPVGVPQLSNDIAIINIPNALVEHELVNSFTISSINCTNATLRIARDSGTQNVSGSLNIQSIIASNSEIQITNLCCNSFKVNLKTLEVTNSLVHITGGTDFAVSGDSNLHGQTLLLFNHSGIVTLNSGLVGQSSTITCSKSVQLTWGQGLNAEGNGIFNSCPLTNSQILISGRITFLNTSIIDSTVNCLGSVYFNASTGNITLLGKSSIESGQIFLSATSQFSQLGIDCGTKQCISSITTGDLFLDGEFSANNASSLYSIEIFPCVKVGSLGVTEGLAKTLDRSGGYWPTIHLVKQANVSRIHPITPDSPDDGRLYTVAFASGAGSQFTCNEVGGFIKMTDEIGNLRLVLHEDAQLNNVTIVNGEIVVSNTSTGGAPTIQLSGGSTSMLTVEHGLIMFGAKYNITQLNIFHPSSMSASTRNEVTFSCLLFPAENCDVSVNAFRLSAEQTMYRDSETISTSLYFGVPFNKVSNRQLQVGIENKNLSATLYFLSVQNVQLSAQPRSVSLATVNLEIHYIRPGNLDLSKLQRVNGVDYYPKSTVTAIVSNGTTVYTPDTWTLQTLSFSGMVGVVCQPMCQLPNLNISFNHSVTELTVTSHVLTLGNIAMVPPYQADLFSIMFLPLDPQKVNIITLGQREGGLIETSLLLVGKGSNATQFQFGIPEVSGIAISDALVLLPQNISLRMPGMELMNVTLDQRQPTSVAFSRNSQLYLGNVTIQKSINCFANDSTSVTDGYCWHDGSGSPVCNSHYPPIPNTTKFIELNYYHQRAPVPSPQANPLPGSQTAGIVVGSLAGVAILAGVLIVVFRNHKRAKYMNIDDDKL